MTAGRYDSDEDDYRLHYRAGKGSRPRSKQRPSHSDAVAGFVVAVDRGRYTCRIIRSGDDGLPEDTGRLVTAMRARELGRRAIVVGDRAGIVGEVSGKTDALARIVRLRERTSVLRRTNEEGTGERVLVANATRMVIVVALTDPPPRTGLIDRCLTAAYDAEVAPLLCLTKADTPGAADSLRQLDTYYGKAEIERVTTRYDQPPEELATILPGEISVLVGHSGVGKSTLVNALVPNAAREIGELTGVGKGRHTTTAAVALALPGGGWIIDTPGVRTFGLAHVDIETVIASFPDLVEGSTLCPPGCRHQAEEPECGLDRWVAEGHALPERLASLRALLASHKPIWES